MKRNLFTRTMTLLLIIPLSLLYSVSGKAQSVIDGPVSNWGNGNFDFSSDASREMLITGPDGVFHNENDRNAEDYIIDGTVHIGQGGLFENASGKVTIMKDLIIDDLAKFTNTGIIYVFGNIINNTDMSNAALANIIGGTIVLAGNEKQIVSGTKPFVVDMLVVNNVSPGANDVELQQTVEVKTSATFTEGIVTTPNGAANPLVFDDRATPINAQDPSHVNGVVRSLWTSGSFMYPVGDGTNYRKIEATGISGNTAGLDCRYYSKDAMALPFVPNGGKDPLVLTEYFKKEYWNLHPVANDVTTKLTVYYGGTVTKPATGDPANLRVAHKTNGSWWDEGNSALTGDIAEGSVTSLVIDPAQWATMTADALEPNNIGWSPITLGSINRNTPLPVKIKDFTGKKQNSDALLTWVVAEEINLAGYAVERSCDGRSFTKIGYVTATGSSTYNYTDKNVPCAKVYYRLRMEDIDGHADYSKTISLDFGSANDKPISVYPNPVQTQFNISIPANNAGSYKFMLYDESGRLVYQSAQTVNAAATTVTIQRPANVTRGHYVLKIYNSDNGYSRSVQLVFY